MDCQWRSGGLINGPRTSRWTENNTDCLQSITIFKVSSAPLVQTGERKQFSLFELDLWHTTLTYNPRLTKGKINPRAKNQGQRSSGSNRRVPTDKRTDTHTTKRIISTRSIVVGRLKICATNPKWRTAAILKKMDKSLYFRNGSTDFYEILHADVHWPSEPLGMFKKSILKNPIWRMAAILKNVKRNIYTAVWPIFIKFGTMKHLITCAGFYI